MPNRLPRRPAAVIAAWPLPPVAKPAPHDPSKIIHFGQFIRHHRLRAGKTTEAFGRDIGLTGRRVIGIEAMATPEVQHTTLAALARALAMEPQELESAWRTTPVPQTSRRAGPTTESAQRFAAACRAARITPAEGMRRLRAWFIMQDSATQQRVLATAAAPPQPLYTDLVDHLQDPAQTAQRRIARRARAKQKKS